MRYWTHPPLFPLPRLPPLLDRLVRVLLVKPASVGLKLVEQIATTRVERRLIDFLHQLDRLDRPLLVNHENLRAAAAA